MLFTARKTSKGFTLIELMVAISIVAILATIGLVMYNKAQQSARDSKRIGDLQEIQKALEQYYATNNKYPGTNGDTNTLSATASYFQNGVVPTDPLNNATYSYSYITCSTANKYLICAKALEGGCTSSRCNTAGTGAGGNSLPADACNGITTGATFYCLSSLSN